MYGVPNKYIAAFVAVVLALGIFVWPVGLLMPHEKATHAVEGVGLLTDSEYNEYLKNQPKESAKPSEQSTEQNQTGGQQSAGGLTKDDLAAAVAAALQAQQGGAGTGTGVSVGSGNGTSGGVIAALQARSGSAVTVNKFSTMYDASKELGMNSPSLNFDTEATKVVLLMPGEFDQLVSQSVNKAFTQDDQVTNLKATLKVAFPGTTVPAVGFDVQTDGSSKAYGWEIKPDGAYTAKMYDGEVSTCTDNSGSADALDIFS